jgi:hypothetical protein
MTLAEMIQQAKAKEIADNESALASCFPPPPPLSPEAQLAVIPFVNWCANQGVRHLPAAPTSVAAFARFLQDNGAPRPRIAESLEAIDQLHQAAAVGSPVATWVVRSTVGGSTIEAPRSWDKEGKVLFAQLPPDIQAKVATREADRETALRRSQNEAAALRNELKRFQTGPQSKPVNSEKEVTTMPNNAADKYKHSPTKTGADDSSWNGEQGSDSMGDTPLRRENKNSWATKDIFKIVNEAHKVDGGFSGKLPNND